MFNLASRTDVGFTGKHPVQTLKTDIIGCLNTLDVAKSNNAVYVFASSSDVYGISNANSYNETATGNIPASFPKYTAGIGKRAAEGLCRCVEYMESRLGTREKTIPAGCENNF